MLDHVPGSNAEVRHERSDASMFAVVLFGVAFVTCAVILHVLIFGLHEGLLRGERNSHPQQAAVAEQRPRLPRDLGKIPEPRLQTADVRDMQELAGRDEQRLRTYGWVDREKQIVRIPIEEALRILSDPTRASVKGIKIEKRKVGK